MKENSLFKLKVRLQREEAALIAERERHQKIVEHMAKLKAQRLARDQAEQQAAVRKMKQRIHTIHKLLHQLHDAKYAPRRKKANPSRDLLSVISPPRNHPPRQSLEAIWADIVIERYQSKLDR
jgi:hypothetical protein